MEALLRQVEASCEAGNFWVALLCALALPDICGAISSSDGKATSGKYSAWFDKYMNSEYDGYIDGGNCYAFRCAALHQGKSTHNNLGYTRVIFIQPTPNSSVFMHKNIINGALNLDLIRFCNDITAAVRFWMIDASNDPAYVSNMKSVLAIHVDGLPGATTGIEVLC